MNAQNNDLTRIQEIYDVLVQTQRQIAELGMTSSRFLHPDSTAEELIVEGLENRVFRVAEEGGTLSPEAEHYGFERKAMKGLRNILAHDYGQVDHRIIWNVLEKEFPRMLDACRAYSESLGVDLHETNLH
ncbi:MAG: DUF86 domain-containing protein [Coriobacteriales bacterium]|jgi:uncharacterized protein with HEPN domain|nr:DUF86 domain-containing protein [Coriobacteriales bacterium]